MEREKKWKEIFLKIAREKQLDPLIPETWYSIPRGEVDKVKVKRNINK